MANQGDARKELFRMLKDDGYYNGDYSQFTANIDNPKGRQELYSMLSEDGYYNGSWDEFDKKLTKPKGGGSSAQPSTAVSGGGAPMRRSAGTDARVEEFVQGGLQFGQNMANAKVEAPKASVMSPRYQYNQKETQRKMMGAEAKPSMAPSGGREDFAVYEDGNGNVHSQYVAPEGSLMRANEEQRAEVKRSRVSGLRSDIASLQEEIARYEQNPEVVTRKPTSKESALELRAYNEAKASLREKKRALWQENKDVHEAFDNNVSSLSDEVEAGLRANEGAQVSHIIGAGQMGAVPMQKAGSNPEGAAEYDRYSKAKYMLDQAQRMKAQAERNINGSSGWADVWNGLNDALFSNSRTLDLTGLAALSDALETARIVNKYDDSKEGGNGGEGAAVLAKLKDGQNLTEGELTYLKSVLVMSMAEAMYSEDTGRLYKAAQVTGQSVPFMAQMAATGGWGTAAKTATSATGRYLGKRIATNLAEKAIGGSVMAKGARVFMENMDKVVKGATVGVTGGALTTGKNIVDRYVGDLQYGIDENGDVQYAGRENNEDMFTAIGKGLVDSTIENATELGLGPVGLVGRGLRKVGGKVVGAVGGSAMGKKVAGSRLYGYVADKVRSLTPTEFVRSVRNFENATKWNGTIEEYLEEVEGTAMRALLNAAGMNLDNSNFGTDKGGLFNLSEQFDTLLGVGLMGGAISAIKTLGYRGAEGESERRMAVAERDCMKVFGDAWGDFKADLDAIPVGEYDENGVSAITHYIIDYMPKDASVEEYAKAAFAYLHAREFAKGVEIGAHNVNVENDEALRVAIADTEAEGEAIDAPEDVFGVGVGVDDALNALSGGSALSENTASVLDDYLEASEGELNEFFGNIGEGERGAAIAHVVDALMGMENTEGKLSAFIDNLSEEEQRLANTYMTARAKANGVGNGVDKAVEQAVEEERGRMEKFVNADGNVWSAMRRTADGFEPVWIQSVSEDGSVAYVVTENENGDRVVEMVSTKELENVGDPQPFEEYLAEYGQNFGDELGAQREAELNVHPNVKTDVQVGMDFEKLYDGDGGGTPMRMIVVGVENGGFLVVPAEWSSKESVDIHTGERTVEGWVAQKGAIPYVMSAEEIVNAQNELYKEKARAERVESESVEGEQPSTAALESESVGTPVSESVETSEAEDEAIPVDEEGEYVWDGVSQERAVKEFEGMDDNMAATFLDNFVGEAVKAHDKEVGKEPVASKYGMKVAAFKRDYDAWEKKVQELESKVDYWKGVREAYRKKKLTAAQMRAAEIAEAKNLDEKEAKLGEPVNAEEYVARAVFGYKYVWDSDENGTKGMRAHLFATSGNAESERRARLSVLAGRDKGGLYPEEVAEKILANMPDEFRGELTSMDVLDMVNATLLAYSSRGMLLDAIAQQRVEAEEQARIADEEGARMAIEAEAAAMGFDNADDYLAWLEQMPTDFVPEELLNQIIDEDESRVSSVVESADEPRGNNEESSAVGTGEQENQPQGADGGTEPGEGEGSADEGGSDVVEGESVGLSDEESESLISLMKTHAIAVPVVDINDENWKSIINTPMGEVKMGENQREKLYSKGRESQYGMLLETLENPDIVLEEKDKENNLFHERPSSYLFIKTFIKEDGSKYVNFESVTVSQEGLEVSVSSHIIRENQLRNKLKSDRLLYKATALDTSANVSAEQPTEGGSLSSEDKGSETPANVQGEISKNEGEGENNSEKQSSTEEVTSLNLNGEEWAVSDIEDAVRADVEAVIDEYGLDAEIVGVKVIGSRMRGEEREDSDLDVLVQFEGSAREDDMFNAIREWYDESAITMNGVKIDVNPIKEGKSGTIEEFMARNAGFSKKETQPSTAEVNAEEQGQKLLSDLTEAYRSGDADAIREAANDVYAYINGENDIKFEDDADMLEDYEGEDPEMLAKQYVVRVSRHLFGQDEDEDAEYIKSGVKTPKTEPSMAEAIAEAEGEVNTNPTEAQKKAGNYKMGHVKVDGFDVTIENPKGSERKGKDADGKEWSITMNNTYGYIRGTEGVDGDHIDVFLSDNPDEGDVFVVDQVNKDGSFDEHKVMYGFATEEEAREAYLANYEEGWTGLGAITHVTKEEFKKWVESSHRKTKPFAEYKSVKAAEEAEPSTAQPGSEYDPVARAEEKAMEELDRLVKDKRGAVDALRKIIKRIAGIDKRLDKLNHAEWMKIEDEAFTLFLNGGEDKVMYNVYRTLRTAVGFAKYRALEKRLENASDYEEAGKLGVLKREVWKNYKLDAPYFGGAEVMKRIEELIKEERPRSIAEQKADASVESDENSDAQVEEQPSVAIKAVEDMDDAELLEQIGSEAGDKGMYFDMSDAEVEYDRRMAMEYDYYFNQFIEEWEKRQEDEKTLGAIDEAMNELGARWANGGRYSEERTAIMAQIDVLNELRSEVEEAEAQPSTAVSETKNGENVEAEEEQTDIADKYASIPADSYSRRSGDTFINEKGHYVVLFRHRPIMGGMFGALIWAKDEDGRVLGGNEGNIGMSAEEIEQKVAKGKWKPVEPSSHKVAWEMHVEAVEKSLVDWKKEEKASVEPSVAPAEGSVGTPLLRAEDVDGLTYLSDNQKELVKDYLNGDRSMGATLAYMAAVKVEEGSRRTAADEAEKKPRMKAKTAKANPSTASSGKAKAEKTKTKNVKAESGSKEAVKDAFAQFNKVLDKFMKAGISGQMSVTLVGLNQKQIEMLGELFEAGANLGYQLAKAGARKFGEWAKQMKDIIGAGVEEATGWKSADVDEFIKEVWDTKFVNEGKRMPLSQWVGEMEKNEQYDPVEKAVAKKNDGDRRKITKKSVISQQLDLFGDMDDASSEENSEGPVGAANGSVGTPGGAEKKVDAKWDLVHHRDGSVTLQAYTETGDGMRVFDARRKFEFRNAEEALAVLGNPLNGMEELLKERNIGGVLRSIAEADKAQPSTAVSGGEKGESAGTAVESVGTPGGETLSEAKVKFANVMAEALVDSVRNGVRTSELGSIVSLRKMARIAGMAVDDEGKNDIEVQEMVELGVVKAARRIVADGRTAGLGKEEQFQQICELYYMQPTISMRSSNRVAMQQYSTPIPMGFVADMFAYNAAKTMKVLEPTAGNGMLVYCVPARRVHANELDANRLANLRAQFPNVTAQNALDPFEGGAIYDAVIANPPFGHTVAKEYDGKMIGGLEEQIMLNALASMKDDGKAAVIIGGNMEYAQNGSVKGNKSFWTYLYDHYNVKGVVDMDGKLYAKQGTTYPTRMILIDGRRSEEERAKSTVYPPVQANAVGKASTFDELFEKVNTIINNKEKTDGTEIVRSERQDAVPVVGNTRRSADESGRNQEPRGGNEKVERGGRGLAGRRGSSLVSSARDDSGNGRGDASGRGRNGKDSEVNDQRVGGRNASNNASELGRSEHGTGTTGRGADGGAGKQGRVDASNNNSGASAVRKSDVLEQTAKQKAKAEAALKDRKLDTEKLPYIPHNGAFSLESVAPASMVEAMDATLSRIEEEHGAIDDYMTAELGYKEAEELHKALAAEQVDSVAMAITQMKNGQGFIIGDQTGVGKGRQMAALIRWANKQGKQPVFFTQKADLFTDIYRDLVDVGSGDLKPFIVNADGAMLDANGKVVYKPASSAEQAKVFASGKLPKGYDYVVVTYSQVNTGDAVSKEEYVKKAKENKQRVSKKDKNGPSRPTPKATWIRAMVEDNYLFMDESHTGAGQSNTGYYMQSISKNAKAVTFASATFAKRPDTMPLYAMRTAMSEANVKTDELIGIIEKGGVTLQEIMSRALTDAGQMVRRERDMSDVQTDWKTISDPATVKKSRENYDKTISAFNGIISFQEKYVKPLIDVLDIQLAATASTAQVKKGTNKMGVDNVPFASKTYNYTKQLMLALKADAIIDEVEAEIKAGRHPVIALESTMESSYGDYAAGEELTDASFAASLLKGLETVMQYTVTDEDGNQVHYKYDPAQLGEDGEKAYYDLQDFIREATSDVFVSPLDYIMDGLRERGYNVGELTGRNTYVERTSDGKAVVRKRTDKDKKRMQRQFNSGELDVLILNKSASTGISLHASRTFSDQRQRSMIIAQPLSDINDYMQMIGRIDRTGQVARGYYINLGLPVPAESRFLMMLSTKLKSLNANTTTAQESESNSVEAPDLLNKYGSRVVVEYLREHPGIYEKMGEPLKRSSEVIHSYELDDYVPGEDDARKITGYVALLSTKEQEEFYNDVVQRYVELIKYLDDTGSNDLKITVMPLRAKTLAKGVSSEGSNPNGHNPFAQNAYVEKVEMDVLRKPMKASEVKKVMEAIAKDGNDVKTLQDAVFADQMAKLDAEAVRYKEAKEGAQKKIDEYKDKINGQKKRSAEEKAQAIRDFEDKTNNAVEERHEKMLDKITSVGDKLRKDIGKFKVGDVYNMPDNPDVATFLSASPAIFCGYKAKKEKVTPSTVVAVFAVLDGRRRVEIPLSNSAAVDNIKMATDANWDAVHETNLDNWDSQIPSEARKEGYILTGNILQAVSDSQTKDGTYAGQLISFTDMEGNVRDGILMPDKWTPSQMKSSGVPISARLTLIKALGYGERIESADEKVAIEARYGSYKLEVPKSTKEGGVYFKNDELLRLVDGDFYQRRGKFIADVRDRDIDALVKVLAELGVRVKSENAEFARGEAQPRTVASAEAQRMATEAVMQMLEENVDLDVVMESQEAGQREARKVDAEMMAVNERFNEELDRFKAKTQKGLMHLGAPLAKLKACGINAKELTLSPNVLNRHLNQHGLTTDDLKGLAAAIQDPILVYKHGEHNPNIVVVTELEANGGKLSISVAIDASGNVVEVNNVRSVHSKDATIELRRLADLGADGLKKALRWVENEKVQDWLFGVSLNRLMPENTSPELLSVAKVLNDFVNPSVSGENNAGDAEFMRVWHGSAAVFDHFDSSHFLEGEGSMVYGAGHYVTNVESTGRMYAGIALQTANMKDSFMDYSEYADKAASRIRSWMKGGWSFGEAKKKAITEAEEALGFFREGTEEWNEVDGMLKSFSNLTESDITKNTPARQLYEVEVPDDNGRNYIRWDGHNVTDQQLDMIGSAITDEQACNLLVDMSWDEEEEVQTPNPAYSKRGWQKVLDKTMTFDESQKSAIFRQWFRDTKRYKNDGMGLYAACEQFAGEKKYGKEDIAISAFLNKAGFVGIKVPTGNNQGGDGRGMNYVIFNDEDLEIRDRVEFMQTSVGTVYGWSEGRSIHLTPEGMNPDTPVHEYAHLWAKAVMKKAPKLWANVKGLMKELPLWDEVAKDGNYASIRGNEDAVASEVLARLSGRDGAKRMTEMAEEMLGEAKYDPVKRAGVHQLIDRVKKAVNDFWAWVGKNLFGIEEFGSAEEVADRVLYDLLNKTDLGLGNDGIVEYQIVTDAKRKEWFEKQEKVVTYKTVAVTKDGDMVAPMASNVSTTKSTKGKVKTGSYQFGTLLEAEEHPELRDEDGRVTIIREDGKPLKVAYDPYDHSSDSMINDQFKSAWERDNLRVIRQEIAKGDLDEKYHAEGALLPTGKHDWKKGVVGRQLSDKDVRHVYLARWSKPVGYVDWSEVADEWIEKTLANDIEVPFNVVPRAILDRLADAGVKIVEPEKGMGKNCFEAWEEWKNGRPTPDGGGIRTATDEVLDEYDPVRRAEQLVEREVKRETRAITNAIFKGIDRVIGLVRLPHYQAASKAFEKKYGVKSTVVTPLTTVDDLMNAGLSRNEARNVVRHAKNEGFLALTTSETNSIVIFANGIVSLNVVEDFMFHEMWHKYLAESMNAADRREFVHRFYLANKDKQKRLVDFVNENYEYDEQADYEEEVFAYMMEHAMGRGWFKFLDNLADGDRQFILDLLKHFNYDKETETNRRRGRGRLRGTDALNKAMEVWNAAVTGRNAQGKGVAGGFSKAVIDTTDEGVDVVLNEKGVARAMYERTLRTMGYKFTETWQDSMAGLKAAMDAIMKAEGKSMTDVADWENAYMAENRLSSTNQAEFEAYRNLVFKPLLEAINALEKRGATRDEINEYLFAKHGLERNEYMARRRAEAKAAEEYDPEMMALQRKLDKGIIDQDTYDERLDELKQQKHDREEELYFEYRGQDFAGLTGLTGHERDEVEEAEIDAKKIVDEFEGRFGNAEGSSDTLTRTLWEKINAATEAQLLKQKESGLMDEMTYQSIKGMYKWYVPLRGFKETTSDEVYDYLQHTQSPMNKPIVKANGRVSVADDPIATIANMAESGIMQANRNLMKQKFLAFVQNHRSDLVSVSEVEMKETTDPITGEKTMVAVGPAIGKNDSDEEIERKRASFNAWFEEAQRNMSSEYGKAKDPVDIPFRTLKKFMGEHVVEVKRGGKTYILTINGNPRAAQALNGLTNPENEGDVFKGLNRATNMMARLNTTYSPAFVLANLSRDGIYTNSLVWAKEKPAYAVRFNGNWGKSAVILPRLIAKFNSGELAEANASGTWASEEERFFYEFMMNGGETGQTRLSNVEEYKRIIEDELKDMNRSNINPKKAMKVMGHAMEQFNRWAEDTSRFAAYMTSRQMGRSVSRSIYDAKDISVNFNKKGSAGATRGKWEKGNRLHWISATTAQIARPLYMFLNAGIQGMANIAGVAKGHPMKFAGIAGSFFCLGMVAPLMAMACGAGDDDDYWNLPEYVRRQNLCIYVGSGYIKIPLPIELRAIYGLGDIFYGQISGSTKYGAKQLMVRCAEQLGQVLPLDVVSDGGMALWPSAAKPIVEIDKNTDWTGLPIYKKIDYLEHQPEWTKAYKRTDQHLVKLCEAMNEFSGGNRYRKGGINLNPAVIEHLYQGYLGGMGTFLSQTKKTAIMLAGQQEYDARLIPVFNRFYAHADERMPKRRIDEDWYENRDEMEALKAEHNGFRKDMGEVNDPVRRAEGIDGYLKVVQGDGYAKMLLWDSYMSLLNDLIDARKESGDEGLDEVIYDVKKQMNEIAR